VKFAESLLDERFLMLNGDVLTDIDLTAQIAQHEATGAAATLALVVVDDPSNYGLVRLADDDRVLEFLEKPPADAPVDIATISAGAYVLERSVLDLLEPDTPASIEREVFPRLVDHGLYGHVADGYWLDIGTPERYLQGTFDILEGVVATQVQDRLGDGYLSVAPDVTNQGRIVPAAIVEPGCSIGEGAHIGGRVVLDRGVRVGAHSVVERAVLLPGAEVGEHCVVRGAVVGPGARVGDHTHVEGLAVLGEGVTIGAENVITNGARIFPGVAIPDGGIKFQ
jgi:mannose-1-phosphate guanylyltransferase